MDSCVCSYMWQPEGGTKYFLLLFALFLRNWIFSPSLGLFRLA